MTHPDTTSRRSRLLKLLAALSFAVAFVVFVAQRSTDDETAERSLTAPTTSVSSPDEGNAGDTTTPTVLGSTTTLADTDPATLYVSPTGNDTNSGQSPEVPFRTLEHAIGATKVGMTLYLMDGTHTITRPGPTQIAFRREGSPEAWTRITAAPGAEPVVIARQGTALEPSGNYIEISGLTVRGEGFGLDNAYGVGILVADGHHFRITDNVVSGFPVGGIAAVRASHLRFERNVVFENSKWGPEQGSGLSSWIGQNYGFPDDEHGYTDYFLNNVIYRNENRVTSKWSPGNITDGNGIIIDMNLDSGFTGRTLIANNIIVDNGGRSITVYKSQRVDIVNNSTFANGRTGASLLGGGAELSVVDGRDVRLSNNLLWNDGTWPTMLVANSRDVTATANALVGGGVEGIASDGNLLLSGDPGVASSSPGPDSGDFHLLPGSPLIDAGVAIPPVVSSDVLGNARTVGDAVDIGAIEWSAGTAPRPSAVTPPPTTSPPTTMPPTTATPTTLPAASTPTSGTPTTAPATTSAVPERTPVTTADPTTDERADALPTPAAEPLALAPHAAAIDADGLDPAGSPAAAVPVGPTATPNELFSDPTTSGPLLGGADNASPTPPTSESPTAEPPGATPPAEPSGPDLASEPPPALAFTTVTRPSSSHWPAPAVVVTVAAIAGLAIVGRTFHPERRRR